MLQWMREAQGWFIKGVLGAVVLAFVVTIFYQWGVQSSGGPTRSEVATIFGQPVNTQDFQKMYNSLQQRYRDIFRTQSDLDLNEHFNFREMAIEQLAARAILLRLAQQYGVEVTQQELYDHIASMAPFQENGRFSPARYQLVLRSQVPPMTPRQFEAQQQRDLLLQKVSDRFTTGVHVTDTEVEQSYRRDHEQAAVRYVTLAASLFEAQVTMTDEDLKVYYEAHKEGYREPEQRQIRYVAIPLQRFTQHADPTAVEINDYYTRHSEMFQRQEEVRARHILVRVARSASAQQEAEARTRAAALLTALRNGGDFAALAQQHSEDPGTAAKGGDLGYFTRGQMERPFEDAAFALPVGQLSELVRSPFGWHILRVEDKREAVIKPLAEVEQEVRDKLREDKARDAAAIFVDDLLTAMEARPQQFAELAQPQELEVVTTPFIAVTEQPEGLADVPDLVKRAFTLPELGVDTLQGKDGTSYVFQTAAIHPARLQEFSAVRERVTQELRLQQSSALAQRQAEAWAAKAQTGTPLADLAAELSVPVLETGLLKRRDPIPELGSQADFSRVAFGLPVGGVGVAHDSTRHFVIQVTDHQPADMQAYETDKPEYRQKLLTQKRQQTVSAFQQFVQTQYQTLRRQGEIVVNPQYVF